MKKIYSRCFCKNQLFTPVQQNKSGTCCIEKEADQRKRRNILAHSQKTADVTPTRVLLQTLNLNFLMSSLVNSVNSGCSCSRDYLVLAERKERPEHMTLSTR